MCSHSTLSLRFVPMWHNRRGNITEIKVRFVPLTMCRRTDKIQKQIIMISYDICTILLL